MATSLGLKVYTDGSCLHHTGAGGWAFLVLNENGDKVTHSGGTPYTTNNRMELTAVIEALHFVTSDSVEIYTDSKWVIECGTGRWKRKMNLDLWKEFDAVSENRQIKWFWVKGHSGNLLNEQVDKLAREKAVYYDTLR